MVRKKNEVERRERTDSTPQVIDNQASSPSHRHSDPVKALFRKMGNQTVQSLVESGTLSAPDSPAERAAEQVADRIVRVPNTAVQGAGSTGYLPDGNASGGDSSRPLSRSERSYFEPRFGQDLGDVRIHTGPRAQRTAAALKAQAITAGRDILLGEGQYRPGSAHGRRLLAHELAHVIQHRRGSSGTTSTPKMNGERSETVDRLPPVSPEMIHLKRDPDIIKNGYYTFYLQQGSGGRELAVQFHYSGSGRNVTVKVAHVPSTTMRQGTITLPESAAFSPEITVEGPTITLFDLDGDGDEELAVQARIDEYTQEFLTDKTTPNRPAVESFDIRDVYVVATWSGGNIAFEIPGKIPPEAIAPPIWRMTSHPHPNIGMVYTSSHSSQYVIPPRRMPSLTSTAKGPLPFFQQERTMTGLRRSFKQQPRGGEAVTDPFAKTGGPAKQGALTPAHQELRGMEEIEHEQVPEWGATDVAKWKTTGGQKYLLDYKKRWVKGYRKIIRAAADTYDLPRVLVAGVAFIEVGGDPDWIDAAAYGTRKRVPFTDDPGLTSIAPMSLQVRRAAEELGYDPEQATTDQLDAVAESLKDPQQAIFLAAKHLSTLRDVDFAGKGADDLTVDEIVVIATRYNQGPDKPLSQIRLNRDYGIAIMKRGEYLLDLLKD